MSRLNNFVQHAYIADGFADDCEELIHKCLKVDFLKFETFCDIWKEMDMSTLYQGRTSGAEIAELSEEVIHVAKHYMVGNTSNFEESVAGLFLVYALVNLQPFPRFASLRIVQDDLPAIERIAKVARRDRRHDVLYILGSVLVRDTQYLADVRERGMEYPIRKYLEEPPTIDRFGARPKGVFYRQNEELDIIRELSSLEKRYLASKDTITGSAVRDRNLEYSKTDFAKELDSSLKNLISGIVEETPEALGEDGEEKESAQSIKQKAMRAKVNPMKHLIGVEDSIIKATPKSPTKKSDIKPASGKVKTGSPTKPVATGSRKRKNSRPTKAKGRRKQPRVTEDCSEPDTSSSSEESHDDIDLDNFHKPTNDTQIENETEIEEHEIDIKIDTLPCLIRAEENGRYYEIEIIDKQGVKKNKKVTKLPDVTLQKVNEEGESSKKQTSDGDVGEMAELLKISNAKSRKKGKTGNIGVSKNEKCDLKKKLVKSKFSRLGLLSVANIEPK